MDIQVLKLSVLIVTQTLEIKLKESWLSHVPQAWHFTANSLNTGTAGVAEAKQKSWLPFALI